MAKEYTPFKMKGSPMQRNFGIGDDSPLEQNFSYAATHIVDKPKTDEEIQALKEKRARQRRKRRQWLYKKTGWKVFDY